MQTFTQKVYVVVAKIPKGETLTYKEVARLAGSPRAYRAVGNIMHNNPAPSYSTDRQANRGGLGAGQVPNMKTIPCHRVIRSDGTAGGYTSGPQNKIKLLKQERAL